MGLLRTDASCAQEPLRRGQTAREHFDVVVVGTGPAGSAATIGFARACPNAQIALVDKAAFPRGKPCGGGLGPLAERHLRDLGLDMDVLSGSTRIDIAEVHGPGSISLTARLPAGFGRTVRRARLDDALRQQAAACGVAWLDGTRVEVADASDADTVALRLRSDDSSFDVSCRLLVGANEANSRVRRSLRLPVNAPRRVGIAIRGYVAVPSDRCDRIVLSFCDQLLPGYGWCFPFSDGTANIGVGMVRSDYRAQPRQLEAILDAYLGFLAERGIQTSGLAEQRVYTLPYGARLPRLAPGRVALIGDAASLINHLSGEGVAYALAGAELLVDAAASAVSGGRSADLRAALPRCERAFRRRYGALSRSNLLAQMMLRSPRWCRTVPQGRPCRSESSSSQSMR